jgi:hypothetical protein
MMKRMIYRIAFFVTLTFLCVSCASTDYQSWEGRNSVFEGRGGTRKVVDGMDIWTHGDPPRRFKVLGIIEDERPGGLIPMAQLKHDIVEKARARGGNAVIFVSSASQLGGYYTRVARAPTVTAGQPEPSALLRLSRLRDAVRHTS